MNKIINNVVPWVILGVVVIGIAAGTFAWEKYKWDDCRSVGHGLLYCIADIGH